MTEVDIYTDGEEKVEIQPERYSSKQKLAIELLGRGDMKYGEIATVVGISENTLSRWRKDPAFMNEVALFENRKGAERREKIMNMLDDSVLEAVGVIAGLLKSDNDNIKLKAAQAIIDIQKKMTTDKDGAIEVSFQGMPVPAMPIKDVTRGVT